MIVALAGGVGGARLAQGLAGRLQAKELAIVVNTGDDFEHLGLAISPDLDTVMYTLAGLANPSTGWGRRDETWSFMATLAELRGETWFRLGDRDLAVHVMRTTALARGEPLSRVTQTLARSLGVDHAIVPMSEAPVRTKVLTDSGELAFQDYFVRLQCAPRVRGFRFEGSARAVVPEALRAILQDDAVEAVVICPSNPYISIDPILSVTEIADWLRKRRFPVVAVSPIVGGDAVKGPAAKMMRELGLDPSAAAVAERYGALVDGWVIDERDAELAPAIQARGHTVRVADSMMTSRERSVQLAEAVLTFACDLATPTMS